MLLIILLNFNKQGFFINMSRNQRSSFDPKYVFRNHKQIYHTEGGGSKRVRSPIPSPSENRPNKKISKSTVPNPSKEVKGGQSCWNACFTFFESDQGICFVFW